MKTTQKQIKAYALADYTDKTIEQIEQVENAKVIGKDTQMYSRGSYGVNGILTDLTLDNGKVVNAKSIGRNVATLTLV